MNLWQNMWPNGKPTMNYRDHTFNCPSFIKRYAHQKRLNIAFRLLGLDQGESFLNYGGGNGSFAEYVIKKMPSSEVVVFEPVEAMYHQIKNTINVVTNLKDISSFRYNKIACLEVLEHLSQNEQMKTLKMLSGLLSENGKIIISVPIETGLPSIFKAFFRIFVTKNEKLSLAGIIKSLFSIKQGRSWPIKIDGMDFISSHFGFDHRIFEESLYKTFNIENKCASPIPFFGTVFNHCIYYVCSNKNVKL